MSTVFELVLLYVKGSSNKLRFVNNQYLLTLYTRPLSAIIFSFDINHHIFADDTQIYMSLSVSNSQKSLQKSPPCLMDVSVRIIGSQLKLNPSKIEFLLNEAEL